MLKHATSAVLLALSTVITANAAPFESNVSGITFSVSADQGTFSTVTPYDGGPYNGVFSVSRVMDDLPTSPFSIAITTSLPDAALFATVDVVRPWVSPNVLLFSLPYSSISTSAVGGSVVPGTHTYNFASGPTGLSALLSVDFAQAFGGHGLSPAVGSDCKSIDCMLPFSLPKTLVVNIWISQIEAPQPPVPEPEGAAIASSGLAALFVARLLNRTRRKTPM